MKKKEIAKESTKTIRAKEKLQKQIEEINAKITPQALEQKVIEIQNWISRHSPQRIVLKNKAISLFDENQNAAPQSQKVSQIAEQIKRRINIENE